MVTLVVGHVGMGDVNIYIIRFSQVIMFFVPHYTGVKCRYTISYDGVYHQIRGKVFILFRFSYNISDKVKNDFFVLGIHGKTTPRF